MKTIYITEVQRKKLAGLLLENEGTNMKRARKYLESKGYSPEKRQQILDSIRTDIPNSRLQQCKFLLGVTRLYMEGQLNNAQNIAAINKTLKYIASDTHVNEYDFNLNGENLDTLVQRFAGVAKDDLQASMNASNARQLTINDNYTIIPIDSPEEASKYGEYTSWCVTHDENMYNSYTHNGSGRFYFCLHKGFENEPKVKGEGCPLDNYGLSMIAVSVTMEGEVNTITCRWNHNNGGNDSIMTIEQLEDIIGRNFYQTFKPYTREELHAKGVVLFDEVQELLDNGKKPEEIFDIVVNFSNGFARVFLNDKYNFINDNRQLISKTWFDYCYIFSNGFSRVELNKKYNYINTNGQIISNTWFDRCFDFIDGFARVELNDKYNYINTNEKIISNIWFDSCTEFYDGFSRVELNDKWNFINTNGQLFSDTWFDYCYNFSEGFAIVKLSNKYNFINTNGEIISNTWFNECYDFDNGFAIVGLNDKWNFINTNGQLISDTWFDECYNFINGEAWVKLNGKKHYINTNGQIIESKSKKTIYITETQEKKIKKAIAAQDQVGGKVNAGVMDAVVGIGENVESDTYKLGAEKGMSPYYHVNESNEEIITLYHGVNRKGLEFNLEKGGFVPRVCSEGGPKAVWLSEKQYNYEFTFAFDFPKSLVEQLSNVDYIFTGKIGFNDFNCRLVKTSINSFLDDIVIETNILNDKLSKLHFRYFPDLGITLWKEFEQYPNILETYINPFIEKYQTLSESKKKVVKNDKGEVVPDTCDKCGGEVVVQIHGEPVYVCKDCGKYFGAMPFTLKENIESEIVNPEDVDLSSFNIKKNLNPKFWKNGVLDSRIRMKLLDIADDFIEFLGVDWAKPEDITITGSLANFNWDENYSDIDLHIIMDYSDVDERTEFVSNYFYSQKKLWNEEHSDITIMGYPVEVFVQDINERHDSSGIYSLEKNKWLIEPEREKLVSSKVNKVFIKDKISEYMNKIDKLEYLLNKSKDDEYRLRRVMEKSDKLFDKIKVERKIGFERSGGKEINNYNIVFKALRRNGYIEKLVNVKSMAYDKLNSLH